MFEVWKDVVGYEGIYKVSDKGQVKSDNGILTLTESRGYLYVNLFKNGKRKTKLVHRLVLESFLGPCPPGMEVRHFPDRRGSNCKLSNLSYASHQVNCADQVFHNTLRIGSMNGRSKIDEVEAAKIVEYYSSGDFTQEELGTMFGMSFRAIGYIVSGRTWSHATKVLQKKSLLRKE